MEVDNTIKKSVNGGGISFGTFLIGGGIVSFLIGLVDGLVRPLKC